MSTQDTPTHITLVSQGGISLGAYMAGVFFEIVKEALAGEKFVIDIITGASAGAMTATIASYYLLKGTSSDFVDPKKNALYQAWVDKADMKNIDPIIDLTQRIPIEEFEVFKKKGNRKPLSLLSGYAIEDITNLIKKTPERINRPLALLMTVTNLQGLIIQSSDDGSNKSISNAEYRQFLFYPGLEIDKQLQFTSIWQKAIDSCRASGAFPIAFPPLSDTSNPKSINLEYLSNDYFDTSDRKTHTFKSILPIVEEGKLKLSYTDGGILDNLPILKGINLEAAIANSFKSSIKGKFFLPQVENDDNYADFHRSLFSRYPELQANYHRLHVYVKPNPVSNIYSPARLTQTSFTMLENLVSSLTLPHDEYEATQLRQIIEIGEKVKLKKELLALFNNSDIEINQQIRNLDEIVPYNNINLSPISPLIINSIQGAINSIEQSADLVSLRRLKPIYDRLLKLKTIEKGLDSKDPSQLLASDFINAFGRFFDKKYRQHDFMLGRICGMTWLCSNFEIEYSQTYIQQIVDEIESNILAENPDIGNLKWSDRTRILRIILRFFRITILELKSDKIHNIWDLLYLPIVLTVAIILRSIDLVTTFFLLVFYSIEQMLEKSHS
jgi:predicted acylesterase/phospholipase RssA